MTIARISELERKTTQSGKANTGRWLLEFERETGMRPDPLTGWNGSRDTRPQVRLNFPTKEAAIAYARGGRADRAFWQAAIAGERILDEDLAHAVGLMRATDALSDTIDRARHYGRRAVDALGLFAGGKAKTALTDAVKFAIARAY